MDTFIISKVRSSDVPDIKKIEVECGLSPWTIAAYETEQRHPDAVMLKVSVEDGSIVGFVVGRAPVGGDGEILNIGTALACQRQGIGSMLIEEFRRICTERRLSTIWLEVRSSNRPAIDFYRSRGFIRKGVRPNFYSNPTEDADLMVCALT